jgi:hypothetical protein
MIAYRLKKIVDEIQADPREDAEETFTYYRIWKETGIAYSTIIRLGKGQAQKTLHSHVIEALLDCVNKWRNQSTPEYTFNELLEMVSEADLSKRRQSRKKRNG